MSEVEGVEGANEAPPSPARSSWSGTQKVLLIVVVLVLGGGVIGVLGTIWGDPSAGSSSPATATSDVREWRVRQACDNRVDELLTSPGSKKIVKRDGPVPLDNGNWAYGVTLDSQNGFGALLRSQWVCVYRPANETASVQLVE